MVSFLLPCGTLSDNNVTKQGGASNKSSFSVVIGSFHCIKSFSDKTFLSYNLKNSSKVNSSASSPSARLTDPSPP